MENKTRKLLMSVGIDPSLLGYEYLVDAILVCRTDKTYIVQITKKLYPYVAKKNNTTPSRVERAMRHAIENATKRCPDICERLLFQPSLSNGKYTNSQFISACVELLRMEER